MQTYARIQNGVVVEVINIDETEAKLSDRYHAAVVSEFIPLFGAVALMVKSGHLYDGAGFTQPAPPVAVPVERYVTVATIRERLEAEDRWGDLVDILKTDMALMMKVLTLRDGILASDPQARQMIAATGADPDVILAP